MIVEHSFISTLDEQELIRGAAETLAACGFAGEWKDGRVEAERGAKSAAKAKWPTRLPQRATVSFDRGLVSFAASIEVRGREKQVHRDLMLTLATTMEAKLGRGESMETAGAQWQSMNARIDRRGRRSQALMLSVLAVLVLGIVGLIVLATMA